MAHTPGFFEHQVEIGFPLHRTHRRFHEESAASTIDVQQVRIEVGAIRQADDENLAILFDFTSSVSAVAINADFDAEIIAGTAKVFLEIQEVSPKRRRAIITGPLFRSITNYGAIMMPH